MAQAKIVVTSGDVRLELEGDKEFVELNLEKLLPIVRPSEGNDTGRRKTSDDGDGGGTEERAKTTGTRQTLKNFVRDKSPGNASEAIAVVLHYKRQHEQKDELSGSEIRNALLQGGHRPPDQMPQALTDCRRRYGYVEVGTKKGFWRLSHQGETLVEIDLPRSKAT